MALTPAPQSTSLGAAPLLALGVLPSHDAWTPDAGTSLRAHVRRTWGSIPADGVLMRFVLSEADGSAEEEHHGDIVRLRRKQSVPRSLCRCAE